MLPSAREVTRLGLRLATAVVGLAGAGVVVLTPREASRCLRVRGRAAGLSGCLRVALAAREASRSLRVRGRAAGLSRCLRLVLALRKASRCLRVLGWLEGIQMSAGGVVRRSGRALRLGREGIRSVTSR